MKKRRALRRTAGRERRRFKRCPLKGSVGYRILRLPPPGCMVELLDSMRRGRGRDIGRGGACFHAKQLLLPGTVIRLELPRSPLGHPLHRRAKVAWIREVRPGNFRVGVKFL